MYLVILFYFNNFFKKKKKKLSLYISLLYKIYSINSFPLIK